MCVLPALFPPESPFKRFRVAVAGNSCRVYRFGMRRMIPVIFLMVLVVGCTRVTYREEVCVTRPPKEKPVDVRVALPAEMCVRIGMLDARGSELSGSGSLRRASQKRAAQLGADFIMLERSGVDKGITSGYATVGSIVLPTVRSTHHPWGIYSVWCYTMAELGIKLEGDLVKGYRLGGAAELAGVQIGDQLLGVDGIDVDDGRFKSYLLELEANAVVDLHLWRDGERIDMTLDTAGCVVADRIG